MKSNQIKLTLILIIISICVYLAYLGSPAYLNRVPKINEKERYMVTKTLDGDTFEIKIGKRIMKVRMMGIDTPETLDPRKPVQCYGYESSEKTKELLSGRSVSLRLDKTQSALDKFKRLLAYVYRDDGIFINQYLLENGYAREYTYNKKYQNQKEFKEIEKKAREEKRGLWGSLCL